jgi:N-acetylmuramoyl-L-alanine amidase CwlA
MEILQAYQTNNRCYKQGKKNKAIGIVVHSTGAVNRNLSRYVDAPERLGKNKYGNHWNKAEADKCMHAFIGHDKDQKVLPVQTLPYDYVCWGSGKGKKGSYNGTHIQFEICQGSNTDEAYYREAVKCAEEYCAYLCRMHGWTADCIISHREAALAGYASNHGDPESWMKHFDDDMDQFRARVAALLGESVPTEPEVIPEAVPAPSAPATSGGGKTVMIEMSVLKKGSKGEQVKTLQRLLTAMGYPCGAVDGSFGNNTLAGVKSFQKGNKLAVDGSVGIATWTALLK